MVRHRYLKDFSMVVSAESKERSGPEMLTGITECQGFLIQVRWNRMGFGVSVLKSLPRVGIPLPSEKKGSLPTG